MLTKLIIPSDNELLLKHNETDEDDSTGEGQQKKNGRTQKYAQIRGKNRENIKAILKHRSARDYRFEIIKSLDKEMFSNGHKQNLMSLNTLYKINAEANDELRLKLQSKDIEDLIQFWVTESALEDPYLRVVTFPLRAIMFTKEQLQIIEEEDLRILFMDATSSIIRKPQSLRCKKIFYYCQVFRLNGKIIPAAEMLTTEHNTKSISYTEKNS